ncbi:unnamed protein product [Blumeria hordei]|uniref:Acyl-protein thioesterase 1 n=1 Tax=Blumeria hordei TaxID=2867405 RepID=A0A383UKC9_BLUHO|nr:unnamed protein product [Blumeria hordei]
MSFTAPIIIPAVRKHTATVIVAHGLGDSGDGWVWLAENWRRRHKFEEVKFIFPHAPKIPISMTQLNDLQSAQDETGILRSRTYLHNLINSEVSAGIPADRIVIGGFSQGGAMAIFSGITGQNKLGGIFGLSCYLLLHYKIQQFVAEAGDTKDTRIFMGHGDADPLVKPEWGRMSESFLSNMGFNVDLKMYPGLAHSADPQEINDLEGFLNSVIPPLEKVSN